MCQKAKVSVSKEIRATDVDINELVDSAELNSVVAARRSSYTERLTINSFTGKKGNKVSPLIIAVFVCSTGQGRHRLRLAARVHGPLDPPPPQHAHRAHGQVL